MLTRVKKLTNKLKWICGEMNMKQKISIWHLLSTLLQDIQNWQLNTISLEWLRGTLDKLIDNHLKVLQGSENELRMQLYNYQSWLNRRTRFQKILHSSLVINGSYFQFLVFLVAMSIWLWNIQRFDPKEPMDGTNHSNDNSQKLQVINRS
ncbi:unnamed protein product [Paramecium octaurelia]|uniref:Uncharacterized protein n=1 Tax=Paramecium octaurelia TaxID=43137 RepID=A0A8S1T1V5_PAROT|nr:unnamed protein product [Paramecium octaurelia]